MSGYTFAGPPALTGSIQDQLRQIHTYLYRMNEQQNYALNSLSPENFVPTTRDQLVNGAGAGTVTQEMLVAQYEQLKRMIDGVSVPVDDEVTQDGKNAVSGAAVYEHVANAMVQGGGDGGYYVPAVSADGTLTWTPSKAGMPIPAAANIAGPAGPAADMAAVETLIDEKIAAIADYEETKF